MDSTIRGCVSAGLINIFRFIFAVDTNLCTNPASFIAADAMFYTPFLSFYISYVLLCSRVLCAYTTQGWTAVQSVSHVVARPRQVQIILPNNWIQLKRLPEINCHQNALNKTPIN